MMHPTRRDMFTIIGGAAMAALPWARPSVAGSETLSRYAYHKQFIGCAINGGGMANTRFTTMVAHRFRAEHSGAASGFRFYQRYNRHDGRTGYSTGDGGVLRVELQESDADGLPSGRVIARTPDLPGPIRLGIFPLISFREPGPVVAGRVYHLVYRQLASTRGTMSINDCQWFMQPVPTTPWQGDVLATLRLDRGSVWTRRPDRLPVFELVYADGIVKGQGFAPNGARGAPLRVIQGATMVSQTMRMDAAGRTVTAVTLRPWRMGTTGRPLIVDLLAGDGELLTSVEIPEQQISLSAGERGGAVAPAAWVTAAFPKAVTIPGGAWLRVRVRAPGGARFAMLSIQNLTRLYGFREDKAMLEGRAEVSFQGGRRWSGEELYGQTNRKDLAWPILLHCQDGRTGIGDRPSDPDKAPGPESPLPPGPTCP